MHLLGDEGYWAQHRQKLGFISRAYQSVSGSHRDKVRGALVAARASAAPPSRGPFSRYRVDDASGLLFSSPDGELWTPVVDLDRFVIPLKDNVKYKKKTNRFWANEHDRWLGAAALDPRGLIAGMDKHHWLEARLFCLDRRILRDKKALARLEERRRLRWGVDVFGFAKASAAGSLDPAAAESASKGFNPKAMDFVPRSG